MKIFVALIEWSIDITNCSLHTPMLLLTLVKEPPSSASHFHGPLSLFVRKQARPSSSYHRALSWTSRCLDVAQKEPARYHSGCQFDAHSAENVCLPKQICAFHVVVLCLPPILLYSHHMQYSLGEGLAWPTLHCTEQCFLFSHVRTALVRPPASPTSENFATCWCTISSRNRCISTLGDLSEHHLSHD